MHYTIKIIFFFQILYNFKKYFGYTQNKNSLLAYHCVICSLYLALQSTSLANEIE